MTAPTPPEVREAAVVEEVARAIYEAADGYMAGVPWERAKNNPFREAKAMRQAAAAVAAYRATQDGGAEEAVRRVEAVIEDLDAARSQSSEVSARLAYREAADALRAALAPQADR